MDNKVLVTAEAALALVNIMIAKMDTENRDLIKQYNYPDSGKKLAWKAIEELEEELRVLFLSQKKEYMKRLRDLPATLKKSKAQVQKATVAADKAREKLIDSFLGSVGGMVFFDDDIYLSRLEKLYIGLSAPLVTSFAKEVVKDVSKTVKVAAVATTSLSERADKWLEQRKIAFAREVQRSTHDAVIQSLRSSLKTAKGITTAGDDLIEALPHFFRQGKLKQLSATLNEAQTAKVFNDLAAQIDEISSFQFFRARRIAQHETVTACNCATLEGWEQSGVVKEREWMCANDSRSRDDHKEADGQVVPLDKPFIVGGEKLMFPGDSSLGASAENVIGCRCTMRAKFDIPEDGPKAKPKKGKGS